MRELKGLEIAARSRVGYPDGVWLVPSQTSTRLYNVILKAGEESCNCEDFALHAQTCKHIHAARFVRERDGGDKPLPIDTDTVPKRPTYRQNWPAYNLAQRTEKQRFQELLADLCRPIEGPAPARTGGYKPHLYRDCVFAIAFKVNSGPNGDSIWDRLFHSYSFHREEFVKHYHQRSNVESTFSMVKAKFRDDVRSKTDTAMKNEVLCKFLCHNICCLIQS
jgi:hypothetical protein